VDGRWRRGGSLGEAGVVVKREVHAHCERWLWARVIASVEGETRHIDFSVQAVSTGLGIASARGTGWVCVASYPSADMSRLSTLSERVSDVVRGTPEDAAVDVQLAVEGTRYRTPWTPDSWGST
jgi:hypothetical protein